MREAELRWVHGGKWIPTGRPGLAEIPQRNGDPIHVETVLEALRSRGVAPEPKPKLTQRLKLSRDAVGEGVFARP